MAAPAVAVACPGAGGNAFVPGFVRKHEAVWDELVLQKHPLRDKLTSC